MNPNFFQIAFGFVLISSNRLFCSSSNLKNNIFLSIFQVGTELYKSPELKMGSNYNHKADIYALGIILTELLFPFQTEMERIKTLEAPRNLFSKQVRPEMSLVKSMLSHSPEERPEVADILKRIFVDQQTRTSPNRKEMNSV